MRINKTQIKLILVAIGGFNFGMLDLIINMVELDVMTMTVPFYEFTRVTHWWWDFHCGIIMVCVLAYLFLDMFEKEKVKE